MRVLILGGTGVISYYVTKKYQIMGHHVTVLNRGNRKGLYINGVEYITGNANDRETLLARIEERYFDIVLDFVTYDSNTMKMKTEVLQKRCRHYVFISSIAVYKRINGETCYTEGMPLGNSEWPYGQKKSECESVLREMYIDKTDSFYTIIRPGLTCSEMFIPYSAFDSYNMPGYLIHCILKGKEILTANMGEDKMQVMHSADFTENLYALLSHTKSRNECFNLCGDEFVTSNQILKRLSECLGMRAIVCYLHQSEYKGKIGVPPFIDVGWHDVHSNKKAKDLLGKEWCNEKKVLDNLKDAVKYFLCRYEYMQWSKTAEKLIWQVINEAKHNGRANISYVEEQSICQNVWAELYNTFDRRIHDSKSLAEKRRINEAILSRWLRLEMRKIRLESYFSKRGITRICLYGYGTLGRQVELALKDSSVEIYCVIDRDARVKDTELQFNKTALGMEEEYILVSVMSDIWVITNTLKAQGCKHIISLEHVLEMLECQEPCNKQCKIDEPYPELNKYRDIDGIKDIEVANFGTGVGYYDFCYTNLKINAFNFSMPQQSIEFDYKLMKHYQDKLLPGCRVCLVLPYCIFLANHIIEIDEINERYYSILPETEVKSRCNTVFKAYQQKVNEWEKNKKNVVDESFTNAEVQVIQEKEMKICQAERLLNIWKKQLGILSYNSGLQRMEWKQEITLSKIWLKKILTLCEKKMWKLTVIVPPMSQFLLDKISCEFREANYYNILYEVTRGKIPILDYSTNQEFCNPDLYRTPCFLTDKGARLFTKDVLKQMGIL